MCTIIFYTRDNGASSFCAVVQSSVKTLLLGVFLIKTYAFKSETDAITYSDINPPPRSVGVSVYGRARACLG